MKELVSVTTAAGEMESYFFKPEDFGAHPAVILYMDAPGIREELFDFCRRIAGHGYFVILPDMYYRLGKVRFDYKELSVEGSPARIQMFEAMDSLNNGLVMDDTQAILDFLDADSLVKNGPKGCIGYCMSGQYVVSAVGTYPEKFSAGASLYGVNIVTDREDSPHLLANEIQAELYFGFADTDPYVPANVIPDLQAVLDQHGVTYSLDVWPGTEHGFCFPARPLYNKDAAEQVWTLVFGLFDRALH